MKRSAIFVLMLMVVSLFLLPGFVFVKGEIKKLTLTQENPIKVDAEAKTVTFLASVNGKYFFSRRAMPQFLPAASLTINRSSGVMHHPKISTQASSRSASKPAIT